MRFIKSFFEIFYQMILLNLAKLQQLNTQEGRSFLLLLVPKIHQIPEKSAFRRAKAARFDCTGASNEVRKQTVTVQFNKFYISDGFGSGEIQPYTIPSMHPSDNPHQGSFEFNSKLCIIKFTEDNYTEATVLKLRISQDFKTLEILERISEAVEGTLTLSE
jgi:hypothetical protein